MKTVLTYSDFIKSKYTKLHESDESEHIHDITISEVGTFEIVESYDPKVIGMIFAGTEDKDSIVVKEINIKRANSLYSKLDKTYDTGKIALITTDLIKLLAKSVAKFMPSNMKYCYAIEDDIVIDRYGKIVAGEIRDIVIKLINDRENEKPKFEYDEDSNKGPKIIVVFNSSNTLESVDRSNMGYFLQKELESKGLKVKHVLTHWNRDGTDEGPTYTVVFEKSEGVSLYELDRHIKSVTKKSADLPEIKKTIIDFDTEKYV